MALRHTDQPWLTEMQHRQRLERAFDRVVKRVTRQDKFDRTMKVLVPAVLVSAAAIAAICHWWVR